MSGIGIDVGLLSDSLTVCHGFVDSVFRPWEVLGVTHFSSVFLVYRPTNPSTRDGRQEEGGQEGTVGMVHTVRKVKYGVGKDVWRRKEVLSRVLYGGRSGSTHVPPARGL